MSSMTHGVQVVKIAQAHARLIYFCSCNEMQSCPGSNITLRCTASLKHTWVPPHPAPRPPALLHPAHGSQPHHSSLPPTLR